MLVCMWRVFRWSSELVLLLFTFSAIIYKSEGHSNPTEESTDYLLCRGCGADIADAWYITNRFSPQALIRGNQTLFGKHSVAVQLLQNPLGIRFQVVVLEKANCIGVGTWHNDYSWFPGYSWKLCLCSHCGRHLGWAFEPLATAVDERRTPSEEGFYGLILDNVLSESLYFGLDHGCLYNKT